MPSRPARPDARPNRPLGAAITIHFAPADLARLRAVRAATGTPISFQVRAAVRAALDATPTPASAPTR